MHFTLCTLHYTRHYTLHFTLTLHTLHFALRILHFTLSTAHSTLYTWHFTLHNLHFTLHNPHFIPYTLHSLFSTPLFLHSALCTPPHSALHGLDGCGNGGRIYKTVEIICFTNVFYVTAFGFIGCSCFLFRHENQWWQNFDSTNWGFTTLLRQEFNWTKWVWTWFIPSETNMIGWEMLTLKSIRYVSCGVSTSPRDIARG